jgi:RimJ/RimL family protein N-acetyltransferase
MRRHGCFPWEELPYSTVEEPVMASNQVTLSTERLVMGPWSPEDVSAALTIFGSKEVTHWLAPAMEPVHDEAEMVAALERWAAEDADAVPPVGHWAVRRGQDGVLIGSMTLRRMPPFQEDLELAWQFSPSHWGSGYATEAAQAVAAWAFEASAHELFAVMRPANERAVKLARRLGMQWVGETDKYYDLRLQVYRLRPTDLVSSSLPA